ncbi:LacI family transcriptional regulator [Erysipelothrix sp. HDW6C]|uniref:LacI family DNA-binding transcriptional regulator n=1 Tax=Erysipelothrix sp. HDW6C TaxID=2714930 RepID=UPI00140E5CCD|nr:LacI family DNA-binding transcriptional regulator [Erysipelothrix sp. HDW6C]QIK70420.1 LacI family transcriptional regulator [Erysipelothrix sp. HDW6C]
MKRIRLKDIAQMAGVSETAVSLVLNGKETRISAAKKEEIRAIAKEHDYRPSYVARSLSMMQTHTIGLIVPDIENPFFSAMSKELAQQLLERGYMVFISNSDDRKESDRVLINQHLAREVDGLILCVSNDASADTTFYQEVLAPIRKPYVLVDRQYDQKTTNQVFFDNEQGGYIATKYMIDQGLRRIACITGKKGSRLGRERFEGYCRALKEHNIPLDETIIFEGDFRFDSAKPFAKVIVEDESIEGVFAANDLMAYAVLSYKINDYDRELSVVGYDNLQQSKMFGIDMPSVEQDIHIMVHKAIEVLFKQIDEKTDSENIILQPRLIP